MKTSLKSHLRTIFYGEMCSMLPVTPPTFCRSESTRSSGRDPQQQRRRVTRLVAVAANLDACNVTAYLTLANGAAVTDPYEVQTSGRHGEEDILKARRAPRSVKL